ncbi:uncharacterized protein LOC107268567 isoform X2 [Cephus cinctus]|nr:uncharacterized protein LOC107268567 isoform X2 [Cephus cinctus]
MDYIVMADTAAKREARRRRILENSESRFQRISGKKNHNTSDENVVLKTSVDDLYVDDTWPNTSKSNINSLSVNEAVIEKECSSAFIDDVNSEIENENYNDELIFNADDQDVLRSRPRASHTRYSSPYKNENANLQNLISQRLGPEKQTDSIKASTLEFNGNINFPNNSVPASSNASSGYLALTSRTMYIVLAAIVNILLALNLDHLFGTAIVIPYIVVTLGRLCTTEKFHENQDGSLLVAALILCNVKPDLIYRVKGILTIFSRILEDFALYIFSFVLIHCAISRHCNDLDTLLPSTEALNEVQVNNQNSDA